jgi:diguanylate cyclase (GGDEF)-like protein
LTGQAGLDAVISDQPRAPNSTSASRGTRPPALASRTCGNAASQASSRRRAGQESALIEMNRELEAKVHERTHELAEANSRLAQLAVTDGLTGLYNHRHFHERRAREVERSGRTGLPLSLLMIDVDHFKHYNDQHGHPAGDEVLRQLARLLADGRRANDLVARYGGVRGGAATPRSRAAKVAERLRERIAGHPFVYAAQQPSGRMSISVGVATFPEDAADAETLVRSADSALYSAKHAGRNCVVLASSITSSTPVVDDDGGALDEG